MGLAAIVEHGLKSPPPSAALQCTGALWALEFSVLCWDAAQAATRARRVAWHFRKHLYICERVAAALRAVGATTAGAALQLWAL